jgi:hypothetical protein
MLGRTALVRHIGQVGAVRRWWTGASSRQLHEKARRDASARTGYSYQNSPRRSSAVSISRPLAADAAWGSDHPLRCGSPPRSCAGCSWRCCRSSAWRCCTATRRTATTRGGTGSPGVGGRNGAAGGRFAGVLVLRQPLRQLQQDLRGAGRRRAQRRNGIADRERHHHRTPAPHGKAPSPRCRPCRRSAIGRHPAQVLHTQITTQKADPELAPPPDDRASRAP